MDTNNYLNIIEHLLKRAGKDTEFEYVCKIAKEALTELQQLKNCNLQSVSKRFTLIKMQERHRLTDEIIKLWHLRNDSGVGQTDYTICGKSWIDSRMDSEDYEFIKEKKGGEITCPDCLSWLKWCASVL